LSSYYRTSIGSPPENWAHSVTPIEVTEGHQNWHSSIGYQWLPTGDP